MKHVKHVAVMMVLVLAIAQPGFPWGKPGHIIIATSAAKGFPPSCVPGLANWVHQHGANIVARCAEPDQAEYGRPYHFVNLEKFLLPNGQCNIPVTLPENDSRGGLPGHEVTLVGQLALAMKAESVGVPTPSEIAEVERLLAWTCHYAADSTCPVHATVRHHENIAVIKTGKTQTPGPGPWPVHSVYETDFVQHLDHQYNLSGRVYTTVGNYTVKPLQNVPGTCIASVKEAFKYLQPIFDTAKAAPVTVTVKGASKGKEWGVATGFPKQWDGKLGPGVESNMARGGELTERLWLTAWLVAGKPALK